MSRVLRDRVLDRPASESRAPAQAGNVDVARRLETLETRLERLETAFEGLQDALYRHEVLQDKSDQRAEARFRQAQHQRLI